MAMIPPALGFWKADRGVFLTTPLRALKTECPLPGLDSQEGRDLLPFRHRHQVRDRLALAVRPDVWNGVHLQPVRPAAVREDHQVGVGRGDEEVVDKVLLPEPHADAALPAPLLVAVAGHRRPLHVARVRDGDRHVLVGDEVLDAELAALVGDLRAPGVGKRLTALAQFLDHDLH
jgi:hypothetical protein